MFPSPREVDRYLYEYCTNKRIAQGLFSSRPLSRLIGIYTHNAADITPAYALFPAPHEVDRYL